MNELIPFNYEDKEVRVITDDNGTPWWVAKEVCDILELEKIDSAIRGLDDDEKGTHKVSTPGGPQDMSIINESGLYNLIFRSNKPEAKKFRKWVTSEVLPAIRKTGTYMLPDDGAVRMLREAEHETGIALNPDQRIAVLKILRSAETKKSPKFPVNTEDTGYALMSLNLQVGRMFRNIEDIKSELAEHNERFESLDGRVETYRNSLRLYDDMYDGLRKDMRAYAKELAAKKA
ncbi:MAG: hypothetical protein GY749_02225 [Desulfobacteraceae bacterium]|nr:hypothetical protein [Desulfobacteraceae bacterium]